MSKRTETSLTVLAAAAGKFQRVTTPWLLAQVAAMQAEIRAEKDRKNARRRELRAIRRANSLAVLEMGEQVEIEVATLNVVPFRAAVAA